jgi:hypothetical protein
MKADLTPADLTTARLLADTIAALPAQERERLAAAIHADFAALVEDARKDGTLPRWKKADLARAVVDAVQYLADRARLLDRLEDALPDLGRVEWELEHKEAVA